MRFFGALIELANCLPHHLGPYSTPWFKTAFSLCLDGRIAGLTIAIQQPDKTHNRFGLFTFANKE